MRSNVRRIICLGDSITLGIPYAELDRWPTQIALRLEEQSPGDYSVYNRGANGSTAHDALNRIDGEIGWLFPAFLLVSFGINEANMPRWRQSPAIGVEEFRSDLREIQRYAASRGGQCGFVAEHFPLPDRRPEAQRSYVPGNGLSYRDNYLPYHRAVLDTADELKTPLVDIPAQIEASNVDPEELVVDDGVHLSLTGNAFYARAVYKTLEPFLWAMPRCG